MLRLAIFGSLFFAIMSSVWATFAEPTPENAAKIMNPTPEMIAEANTKVTPVLEWIFSQTPESILALFKDAEADVIASLDEPATTAGAAAASMSSAKSRAAAGAPPQTAAKADQAPPPGIDWYKGK